MPWHYSPSSRLRKILGSGSPHAGLSRWRHPKGKTSSSRQSRASGSSGLAMGTHTSWGRVQLERYRRERGRTAAATMSQSSVPKALRMRNRTKQRRPVTMVARIRAAMLTPASWAARFSVDLLMMISRWLAGRDSGEVRVSASGSLYAEVKTLAVGVVVSRSRPQLAATMGRPWDRKGTSRPGRDHGECRGS